MLTLSDVSCYSFFISYYFPPPKMDHHFFFSAMTEQKHEIDSICSQIEPHDYSGKATITEETLASPAVSCNQNWTKTNLMIILS